MSSTIMEKNSHINGKQHIGSTITLAIRIITGGPVGLGQGIGLKQPCESLAASSQLIGEGRTA